MHVSVREAAERLGMSPPAIYEMIRAGRLTASGRPALVDDASIIRVAQERRTDALARVGDETEFAHKVARILDPKPVLITRADGTPDPQSLAASMAAPRGAGALHLVPADSWSLWGPVVLRSAAARPTWDTSRRGCLTCWTRITASVHQTLGPRGTTACRILLGEPCTSCTQEFAREADEARLQIRRMGQQLKGQAFIDRVDRIHAERAAAMADVQRATARFGRAHAEWKRLPESLRTGGRR